MRTLRRISDFVNWFPFAGKPLIRSAVFWALSDSSYNRFVKTLLVLSLLVFYVYGHYIQMTMGWGLFLSAIPLMSKIIGLIYALANGLVVYTQIFLFFRVIALSLRHRGGFNHKTKPYSFGYILLCVVFTLAGQLIFSAVS